MTRTAQQAPPLPPGTPAHFAAKWLTRLRVRERGPGGEGR
jgi:hypothetical protein